MYTLAGFQYEQFYRLTCHSMGSEHRQSGTIKMIMGSLFTKDIFRIFCFMYRDTRIPLRLSSISYISSHIFTTVKNYL